MIRFLIVMGCFVLLGRCRQPEKDMAFQSIHIRQLTDRMTDIMVHDVTNPPLAARFFAYTCLAGYEVAVQHDPALKSMQHMLRGYPAMEKPDSLRNHHPELAALLAMIQTARKLQPSGRLLDDFQKRLLDSCRMAGMAAETILSSLNYAQAVSRQVLAYAHADRYNRISNFARYAPSGAPGAWYPTPPAYLPAVEPYFHTIRPLTLDTCSQFRPPPPVPFSDQRNSPFYRMMEQNYRLARSPEQKMVAAYWDCNPFAVQDNGHLLVGLKKISPGAHWIGITGIACTQAGKSFQESLQVFTLVSIGLLDAFICCWDEKYRSNRIRPETAIRRYLDPEWTPLLQTPPFPEYLSGHSTISATAATILSRFFGNHFPFTDATEVRYGLGTRNFASFHQAANEAAISRFYGGIHFMDAIDNGLTQGERVGAWVLQKAGFATRAMVWNRKPLPVL